MIGSPDITVVIPTLNRCELLKGMLESLTTQTLRSGRFEVIVVDDGSDDDTPEMSQRWADDHRLRYVRMSRGGLALAKNLGLLEGRAPLVLFLDDDDLAAPDLLERHVETHRALPDEHIAVLGYTTWAPDLDPSPLMHFVTEVGQHLFAYRGLTHGELLSFQHFWGGRSSCKRAFLLRHGLFNPIFTSIIEDIELGYRLSKAGLRVAYDGEAIAYMARPITYLDFCDRCERRGRALAAFLGLHRDPAVREYCDQGTPTDVHLDLDGLDREITDLEHVVSDPKGQTDPVIRGNLHWLYWHSFQAHQRRGFRLGMADLAPSD